MGSNAKKARRRPLPSQDGRPARVGPYRLCLELAAGGMATVYLACNEAAGAGARYAAVKLVHPHLAADPGFVEMFVDEAEIASRIRHPNVCTVFDYDVAEGRSYLAMEYLIGEPMAAVWRKLARAREVDPVRTARFVARALADACEGLHAAHELTDEDGEPLEIVHRDVSPANIVITFDGVTKVVDFGVAGAARKRHRTQTGMVKGKLAYVAPESLRGKRADRRSDVWAIGVVAWEMVTGQRLFRAASDVDTLRAVMDAEVRAPSEVRPGLPADLDAIVMLALGRDPDERYPTARELGRELARFANRDEVITSADLGEWLDELFPGGRQRKQQLLDVAAQVARAEDDAPPPLPVSAPEPTPPTRLSEIPPVESDTTRVYDREPSSVPSTPPPRSHPTGRGLALVTLGVGLVAGAGATWAFAPRPLAQNPVVVEPPVAPPAPPPALAAVAAPPEPAEPALRPELRIRPGAGLARGPYVLELVDSDPDELLLRIRLDHEPATEAPSEPAPEPPPAARRIRTR